VKARVLAPLLLGLGAVSLGAAILRGASRPGSLVPARYSVTRGAGTGFPKALENGHSRQTIPRAPVRIASLTVTADEILTAIAAPDRIAAVTYFADDPAIEVGAGRAPARAARIRGIDPEAVIALEPDLVFVAHYTLESAARILGSASIPVVRFQETRSYDDVASNVRLTAWAIGEEARGEEALSAMRARLASVAARTAGRPRPRVLYYSAVGYTAGTGTLIDEKIRLAGGRNVAAEAGLVGFKSVALDLLVGLDPDVIVVPRWSADASPPVRDVTGAPAWRDTGAVRGGRVYAIAASGLTSESPDGTIGVEELARLIHPEAFAS
jgi:iron complex transport system substrate-binding protein